MPSPAPLQIRFIGFGGFWPTPPILGGTISIAGGAGQTRIRVFATARHNFCYKKPGFKNQRGLPGVVELPGLGDPGLQLDNLQPGLKAAALDHDVCLELALLRIWLPNLNIPLAMRCLRHDHPNGFGQMIILFYQFKRYQWRMSSGQNNPVIGFIFDGVYY